MATLILARHGRTNANVTGVLAGRTKGVHLDDTGREQARAAAARLVGVPLAAVVSSPLERCRETAREIVRQQAGAPAVSTERGLLECDYGSWTGRELKSLAKEPLWKTVQAHPSAVEFPDGEAMTTMSSRAVGAVRRWDARVEAEHGPHAVWVAVSHGDVIKAVLADALGIHLDAFQRIVVDPASLSVVRYTPGRPFVVTMNSSAGDLAHLRPPPKKGRRRTVSSDAAVGGGTGSTT
ncbi:MAG TPA: histidine phosphatase family protein [Nocardioidaceae bacterium]|nr:histidine phosphatase family protein [Nocardioidaceae bacterium]